MLIFNIKNFLIPFFILLIVFSPFKIISLLFLFSYLTYELLLRLVKPKFNFSSILVVSILVINLVFLITGIGVKYIANYFLFLVFISPILLFITRHNSRLIKQKTISNNPHITKRVIESFLFIQIFFSFIAVFYRLFLGFNFDTNFGDIVAGTLRLPFFYKPDASNVIFVFTMIIVLFLYKTAYKNNTNKLIEYLSYFIIFLASVNHLVIAALASLAFVYSFKKFHYVIGSLLLFGILYSFLQPTNFNLIIDRLTKLTILLSDFEEISSISLKGQYILNFFDDFSNNVLRFSFVGVGAGNYSSRAALFFTGEYISSFPFTIISPYMQLNTFPLWQELLLAPPFLSGAFHFPYNSIFTFIAELGFLTSILIFILFVYKLYSLSYFNKQQILFFVIFLMLIGLVDNYFEYYQATFIFYYLSDKIAFNDQ